MLLKIFMVLALALDWLTVSCASLWHGWGSVWIPLALFLAYTAALMVLYAATLLLLTLRIDPDKPAGKHQKQWRRLVILTAELILSVMRVRIHASGLEKMPQSGRYLFTCNHLADFDPMVTMAVLPYADMNFISKKENFHIFIAGRLMHAAGILAIDRENDRAAVRTILRAVQLLKEDYTSIALYPEGYCKRDASVVLQPFRDGSLKIAQKAGVPVVVAVVQGTENVKRNFLRKLYTDVWFEILCVLPAEELAGLSTHEIGETIWQIMYKKLEQ